jgi:threonine synthase
MPNELANGRGRGVIDRYRAYLPVSAAMPVVSLGEGGTPLIYSPRLSEKVGRGCEVFVKYEGMNPTGSFKDRGMTVAVSKALERGARTLICASTGNTSASAAAYAARAGMRCAVVLPAGRIASGKMAQAFAYGARIVAIEGNFDQALEIVRALGEREDFAVVNSINPDRIAGQKTAAFEIVDELGDAPDLHLLPVGNAGNITAYWSAYEEFRAAGKATQSSRMIGFKQKARRQFSGAKLLSDRKRWRRPSESATRRAGLRRIGPSRNRAARSIS